MRKFFQHTRLTAETSPATSLPRNPGGPLELEWIRDARVERESVDQRAAAVLHHSLIDARYRPVWLLRVIRCMDLTSLTGEETVDEIRGLCASARQPVSTEALHNLGVGLSITHAAAVCVYHAMIPTALDALRGSGVLVAAVSGGFPSGLGPLSNRLAEIRASVRSGAVEIDAVISRSLVLGQNWPALYDEIRAYRDAAGEARLKAILATGELGTLENVARASLVCMMAGADFIKTSTGKEMVNATLPAGLVMVRAIREYGERTGHLVGFKPAGGIRTAQQSLEWLVLIKEELGDRWLWPDLFRIGCSSLLGDIERQLEDSATNLESTPTSGA
jgi:deoxyribose-phosphate aldolase